MKADFADIERANSAMFMKPDDLSLEYEGEF